MNTSQSYRLESMAHYRRTTGIVRAFCAGGIVMWLLLKVFA